jgi:hypothetical protein
MFQKISCTKSIESIKPINLKKLDNVCYVHVRSALVAEHLRELNREIRHVGGLGHDYLVQKAKMFIKTLQRVQIT